MSRCDTASVPCEPDRLVHKSTKIVSTLGPVSSNPDMLRKLICTGVNVFRLNFSHGSHEEKDKLITAIRTLSKELRHDVAILADLQGPKIRIGELEGHKPFHIIKGQTIGFISGELQPLGNPLRLSTGTKHAHLLVEHLQVGHRVLINDGAIVLRVERRVGPKELECSVVVGGEISEKKGVNVPDLQVPTAAVTEKDRDDAIFAISRDVDYIALSFVQRAQDVLDLRDIIKTVLQPGRVSPKIIAKIEKPQAIEVIDEIIEVVDGIMVARGDLGVECSFEKVPAYQKMLIRKCNAVNKPVITATQMLESMIHAPTPTRAEASDVFNAVFDRTDAVMLSAETASGEYPVEAVQAMAAIVVEAERIQHPEPTTPDPLENAIAQSAVTAANTGIHAQALIFVAVSFEMGAYLAKLRPRCPIIAVTFSHKLAAQLEMCYGCHSLVLLEPNASTTTDDVLHSVEMDVAKRGWLKDGDQFVFCCGDAPLPGLRYTLQLGHFGDFGRTRSNSARWGTLIEENLSK